jgi:hypothetical protein
LNAADAFSGMVNTDLVLVLLVHFIDPPPLAGLLSINITGAA